MGSTKEATHAWRYTFDGQNITFVGSHVEPGILMDQPFPSTIAAALLGPEGPRIVRLEAASFDDPTPPSSL